jgi:hypothetical protein
MKLTELALDFKRCGITPTILTQPFTGWKDLPKGKGLYSIWQDDVCIYVGQGGGKTGIRDRFHHHHNKAHGIEQAGTSHGKGWVANRVLEGWAPSTWIVEYFLTTKAVHRTYLEGAMMLEFDPLCNDETYEDRLTLLAKGSIITT